MAESPDREELGAPMPSPPQPTFYQLQSQAYIADLGGIVDALEEQGIEGGLQAAPILAQAATAAAILDLAHAVRQAAATMAQATVHAAAQNPDKKRGGILSLGG